MGQLWYRDDPSALEAILRDDMENLSSLRALAPPPEDVLQKVRQCSEASCEESWRRVVDGFEWLVDEMEWQILNH